MNRLVDSSLLTKSPISATLAWVACIAVYRVERATLIQTANSLKSQTALRQSSPAISDAILSTADAVRQGAHLELRETGKLNYAPNLWQTRAHKAKL